MDSGKGLTMLAVLSMAVCLVAILCTNALVAQSMQFEDVTAGAGIETVAGSHGVAVTDFDGNGTQDIFVAVHGGGSALFAGNGDGTFEDVTSAAGVNTPGHAAAAAWADVNNDGQPDLFVGIRFGAHPNRLFLNQGDGTFRDVLPESGIDLDANAGSVAFGDFDGDGLVDLFLATRDAPDQLYRNVDGTTFDDVSQRYNIGGLAASVAMQSSWFDYDNDGDLDLFVVHDGTIPNRLYENADGLYFQESAEARGIADVGSGNGMGHTWIDVDLDGNTDVYVTRIFEASLYRNGGNNSFADDAESVGLLENGMSWGVVSEDFDNDADPDIFVVNTFSFDNQSATFLYANEGGHFSNVAEEAQAAFNLDAFGVASGDFNNDGLRDLVIANVKGDNRLLINRSEGAGNWLQIDLAGDTSNKMAIGATVRVSANGVVQQRTLMAGESYCSQSSSVLHFGLGDATYVDAVEVRWSGGKVERFDAPEVNKVYHISEGSGITVAAEDVYPDRPALGLGVPYPNPFVSSVEFEIIGAEHAGVRLAIYDLLGRRVRELSEGIISTDLAVVAWNGLDVSGRDVAPGVYIARLEVGERSFSRRVIKAN